MARFKVKLPKMGESVAEATIISWLKNVGDNVVLDEAIVEIATDKVDSEVPSEVNGTIVELLFDVDAVVNVGDTIAIIETPNEKSLSTENDTFDEHPNETVKVEKEMEQIVKATSIEKVAFSGKFYSPLVKNIATKEGIPIEELETIIGTGKANRVTKNDILDYIKGGRKNLRPTGSKTTENVPLSENTPLEQSKVDAPVFVKGEDELVEMTRMGKLVARHMVSSMQTSAHVQSFIEVDVTNIVSWRNRIKDSFFVREEEKITFTPIFMQAVAKAIKIFPMINISVTGDRIIKRKAINLGMATALADGNLIVPVIKNADLLSLVGMTKAVNDLANRARNGQLNPDDIQDGTYTVTNVGIFGSIFGTPIINQPQVGILAFGAVRKVPAVIETPEGDFIGIRHKMFISHSYDHRVVNGALGGLFIKTIKDSLEAWDVNTEI